MDKILSQKDFTKKKTLPYIIAIEGVDGVGKHTQSIRLVDYLNLNFTQKVHIQSFPSDQTEYSTIIRKNLRLPHPDPYEMAMLFMLDRYQTLQHVQDVDILIFDRYAGSNIIYQTSRVDKDKQKTFNSFLGIIEYGYFMNPTPDITFFLDMDPFLSNEMMLSRYGNDPSKLDRYEADMSYQIKCRKCGLEYASANPSWHIITCYDHAGPISIDMIHMKIRDILEVEPEFIRRFPI